MVVGTGLGSLELSSSADTVTTTRVGTVNAPDFQTQASIEKCLGQRNRQKVFIASEMVGQAFGSISLCQCSTIDVNDSSKRHLVFQSISGQPRETCDRNSQVPSQSQRSPVTSAEVDVRRSQCQRSSMLSSEIAGMSQNQSCYQRGSGALHEAGCRGAHIPSQCQRSPFTSA